MLVSQLLEKYTSLSSHWFFKLSTLHPYGEGNSNDEGSARLLPTPSSAPGSASGVPPEITAASQTTPSLPPPWKALRDEASGMEYYWNQTTGAVQWTRPRGGKEAAASTAAAGGEPGAGAAADHSTTAAAATTAAGDSSSAQVGEGEEEEQSLDAPEEEPLPELTLTLPGPDVAAFASVLLTQARAVPGAAYAEASVPQLVAIIQEIEQRVADCAALEVGMCNWL